MHIVGVSSQAAGHKTLVPALIEALRREGAGDILVVCGGVIPAKDHDFLKKAGVSAITPRHQHSPPPPKFLADPEAAAGCIAVPFGGHTECGSPATEEWHARAICIEWLWLYRNRLPMALSLKDPETDRLAREVAKLTGESLTEAVRKSLAERLERERLRRGKPAKGLVEELNEIAKHCAALPDLDTRSADEIIGYDENGLWR